MSDLDNATTPPTQPAGAAWEKYLPSVHMLRPGMDEDEARMRAGIMLMRDLAMRNYRRACPAAGYVLQSIEIIAGRHMLSTLSPAELDKFHANLVRLEMVARNLQEVFGDSDG